MTQSELWARYLELDAELDRAQQGRSLDFESLEGIRVAAEKRIAAWLDWDNSVREAVAS